VTDNKPVGTGAKIRSIVFDLGGVLFTEGKSVAKEVLSREYGYDPVIIDQILTCERSRDMRKGLISEDAFWSWVQVTQGYDAQVIRDEWYKGYVLDPDVFGLAKKLTGHYKLVAFSENIPDRIAYLDKKYRFRQLFDVEVYSYDHQLGKSEPQFLHVLLKTLRQRPDQILYIDNSSIPLELAKRRGVNVVRYTTGQIQNTEAAIRRLGIPV
jgi:FMN phosphatase YigB (HAD superfamily)